MKRSKFGLGLLLILLLLGTLSTRAMLRSTGPITEAVRQAGEAGFRGNWKPAAEKLEEARGLWEEKYPLYASLTDHGPMEEINGLFARLELYGKNRDARNFSAVCAQLAENLKAIGEAQSLKWWNIL